MNIGQRLQTLREQRNMTQGDLEHGTGLLRCYISRVEHGHTVPSLGTLEKFADALGVPLYKLFCTGSDQPSMPRQTGKRPLEELAEETGERGREARFLLKIRDLAANLPESERLFLLDLTRKLAKK